MGRFGDKLLDDIGNVPIDVRLFLNADNSVGNRKSEWNSE